MLRLGPRRRSAPPPAGRAENQGPPASRAPTGASDGLIGRRPPRWGVRLVAAAVGLLLSVALLEIGLRSLTAFGLVHVPRPFGSEDAFWDGRHPIFGVWHHPRATATHKTSCFNVRYRTNALGARDVERAQRSGRPRVLALGDSYLEGWGVDQDRRLTDLVARKSGVDFMNLAMSHFGPYQELLAYREFGPRFEHQGVLVGILPMNDFYDLDLAVARRSPGYMYRYRPYLQGAFPAYHRVDYRESPARRFLRHQSAAFNGLAWAWFALAGRADDSFDRPPAFQARSGAVHSFYYDYSLDQFLLLRYCLEQIVAAADGRPVVVVLLPAPPDFPRYAQSGTPPLGRDLEALAQKGSFRVVDLLPEMARRSRDWSEYFFTCDYHWNERGNAVAAEILEERLRDSFRPGSGERRDGIRTAAVAPPAPQ